MASVEVHEAVQAIYRGALDFADSVAHRREALVREDEAAASKAAEIGSSAWLNGISGNVGFLVRRIEELEALVQPTDH